MFPEFGYMKYILAGFILYGLVVAFVGKRKFLLSLLALTLLMAGAALYDFYKWGYDYGHNLDPAAAIKVPGLTYQPPVVGHKTLLNFDAYSYPDTGGWVIIVAGATFFVVYLLEWRRNRNTQSRPVRIDTKQVAIAASIAVVFSACEAGAEPFAYGKDACEDCKMTIVEPRFGAEIITKKGRIFKFDDIHCVKNYLNKSKINKDDIKQTLFTNYNKENDFVDGATAFFVTSPQMKSPMKSNTAAFAAQDEAMKKANETGGKLSNWNNLVQP